MVCILIADDEPLVRSTLRDVIERPATTSPKRKTVTP